MPDTYHHGSLREALLRRAAELIGIGGVGAVSLRAIAMSEGVSHTAPRHHFGSRDGLLTALATEGFELLAAALGRVREAGGSFAEIGVAYVEFALDHPGHFTVMFEFEGLLDDDAALQAAQERAFSFLEQGVEELANPASRADAAAAIVASWALMHGLVGLHRGGALNRSGAHDLIGAITLPELAARIAPLLHANPTASPADQRIADSTRSTDQTHLNDRPDPDRP